MNFEPKAKSNKTFFCEQKIPRTKRWMGDHQTTVWSTLYASLIQTLHLEHAENCCLFFFNNCFSDFQMLQLP